jgi:putative ABC transport system ATP-binding protein
MNGGSPIVELVDVCKTYGRGDGRVEALKSVTLAIMPGEFVAIAGASGCGKSTILNLMGCLDVPSSGRCRLAGAETVSLSPDGRARLRRETVGFVFQGYQLLDRMSAWRNVELPLIYRGVSLSERYARVEEALELVGLAERAQHLPGALSGGQQQRVAIARALVCRPVILIADEPTGAVDAATGDGIIGLFRHLNETRGTTVVLVTHDEAIAQRCGRTVRLRDGRIADDRQRAAMCHVT